MTLRLGRSVAVALVLSSTLSLAQPSRLGADEASSEPLPPPPPIPLPEAPYTTRANLRKAPAIRPEVKRRVDDRRSPNFISGFAMTSGALGRRVELLRVGLPLLQARLLVGLGEGVDLGVGVDSFWFSMNQPLLAARVALVRTPRFAFSASLEGGYAFFTTPSRRESFGARAYTGQRNVNLSPALVMSFGGSTPRALRFVLELRYRLGLDLEPVSTTPLGGAPPPVTAVHGVSTTVGVELPLSEVTALSLSLGLAVHGQVELPVIPEASVGVVTSL